MGLEVRGTCSHYDCSWGSRSNWPKSEKHIGYCDLDDLQNVWSTIARDVSDSRPELPLVHHQVFSLEIERKAWFYFRWLAWTTQDRWHTRSQQGEKVRLTFFYTPVVLPDQPIWSCCHHWKRKSSSAVSNDLLPEGVALRRFIPTTAELS